MVSREERESRDELIYRLHLAGMSYRDIAKRSGLSKTVVHRIVKRSLAKATDRRDDLGDEAVTAHLERLDGLLAANMQNAMCGDPCASEVCRRLLADMACVQGLNQSVAERLVPAHDDDLNPGRGDGDSDEQPFDEVRALPVAPGGHRHR